jgi:hypothetical protein
MLCGIESNQSAKSQWRRFWNLRPSHSDNHREVFECGHHRILIERTLCVVKGSMIVEKITFWVLAATQFINVAVLAQSSRPPAIASISVCNPSGVGGEGSCPSGSFDSHRIILAPDGSGNAINRYEAAGTSDEHSSVFSQLDLD